MGMLASAPDLFRQREGRGMETDSCWRACEGGAEVEAEAEAGAGLRCHKSLDVQLLREKHRRRMAQFVAVTLFLLLCGVLALFLTFRLERPCAPAPDTGTMPNADIHSSGRAEKMQQAESAKGPPSAMLTAPYGNNIFGSYLLWEDQLGEAHIQGGFGYSNGSLVVPREGLYRVFLQLTFQIRSVNCSSSEALVLNSVKVFRDSYQTDQPLLSTVDTVVCGRRPWEKSLFTSGLFKLGANDKLRVTSTHARYLDQNEHKVFFGAELVF